MKLNFTLLTILSVVGLTTFAQSDFSFDNEIQAFKHQDSLHFPKPNGILFIGSSSFRKWTDLEQRFKDKPIIRRGVGGCQLSQLVKYYTPYILFPYHPRKIFIYAGENDIAEGRPADSVYANFKTLWVMIRKKLPNAKIYYLSAKYAPVRAKFRPEVDKANAMVKKYIAGKPNSLYINMNPSIYKPQTTMPDSSLFENDYLHLNSKGYDRWQKVLAPYVN
ncbi:GDSL-type esterase/lipase family protein [Mucilaginibacter sp. BT774]|uniref:GDSL-type esterase/lipase family protein n=1 Tax=Mucilaginibacter sp. BT774 TaxID=3062276 RepID=UPI0026775308|nr:GDSL-type esterase/lipase family protein [Mucilaginibacter sp. BT774]MDO3625078.1 GDSL-type esterase/lipase family protein [Mucilaginibacter sp. BT774]